MKYISQREFIIKHGFLFFHIPKNAGTSFLHAIDGENSFLGHDQTAQVAQYHFGEIQLKKIFKLAIIRNPIQRFISSYKYARKKKSYWHEAGTKTEHLDYQLLSNKTIDEAVLLLIYNKMRDPWHWKKQVDFIKVKDSYCINALATQENLSIDINLIMEKIGKPSLNIKNINNSQTLSEQDYPLSPKSQSTLLEFYYEDYYLWKNVVSAREKSLSEKSPS